MRDLTRKVVNRLCTFEICFKETGVQAIIDKWLGATRHRDEPVFA